MVNFDFEYELKKCLVKNTTENGSFTLPTENFKLIPVVFCLLVQIDSKRIDFNYFLKTQFPYAKSQNEEYDKFSHIIVAPFRDAIASIFGVSTNARPKEEEKAQPSVIDRKIKEQLDNENKVEVIEEKEQSETVTEEAPEQSPVDKLFADIKAQVEYMQQLAPYIRKSVKRENVVILLRGMLRVCELQDMLLLNSLMIAVNEFCGCERMLKENLKNISNIYAKFLSENR